MTGRGKAQSLILNSRFLIDAQGLIALEENDKKKLLQMLHCTEEIRFNNLLNT